MKIAICNRRTDKRYRNVELTWEEIKARNSRPIRTAETAAEYPRLSKDERALAKDQGGFVGGWLRGGIRKNGHVLGRELGALDADHIPAGVDFLGQVMAALAGVELFVYSTHSHTGESQRYRVIIRLSREVSEEEYPALMRLVAKQIGLDYFDDTTYQANRMMYWASCPANGEFVFEAQDGAPLDADKYLAMYDDWRDVTEWPTSSRQSEAAGHSGRREGGASCAPADTCASVRGVVKQANPLQKSGVVGAFCRAYSIDDVIEKFLPEVYRPSAVGGRYDYIPGEGTAGVVVYDGVFAYSHHATDPASGQLLNAFDLVRVHKFGVGDPQQSFAAMMEFAARDVAVSRLLLSERQERAARDFSDDSWVQALARDKNGALQNSLHNIKLILENDAALKDIVFNQLADGLEIRGEVPWQHPAKFWRDADDAQLICYVDANYGSFSARHYDIAVTKVADDRSYHPIRDFLGSLPPWDGTARLDTLLIDYLGAADSPYVRAVTRKTLCAAVARVRQPGIKFDNILVLNGPQGIGKSTLIAILGGEWYSDSLSLTDMNDKTAAEKLQGYWILEIGELAGMKKADIDKVKAFISRQDDKYRASFGRRVTPHPRQCVFFGTTNAAGGYLRDITGNRRFWTVKVPGGTSCTRHPWDLTLDDVRQIWAEAVYRLDGGEQLYLDAALEQTAKAEQSAATEQDEREGLVRAYLETLLPPNWAELDLYRRREFLGYEDSPVVAQGTVRRETVCNMEIWCECLGRRKEDLCPRDSHAIAAIMSHIDGWERQSEPLRLPIYGRQRVYRRL